MDPEGRRRPPLDVTGAGRLRLQVLREQLRDPLEDGRAFLEQTPQGSVPDPKAPPGGDSRRQLVSQNT